MEQVLSHLVGVQCAESHLSIRVDGQQPLPRPLPGVQRRQIRHSSQHWPLSTVPGARLPLELELLHKANPEPRTWEGRICGSA